jgi:hypothetical protein
VAAARLVGAVEGCGAGRRSASGGDGGGDFRGDFYFSILFLFLGITEDFM